MSVEQVARDFVSNMGDAAKVKGLLSPDAMVSGGVLPKPMPAMEAFKIVGGLYAAMPDLKFDIQHVVVKGDEAIVNAVWSGTQTAQLSLMPGMPTVPPSGKKVSVKDTFVIHVQNDKVTHMHVESPADGGIPGVLKQLGVQAPGM
jgi:hypothetical protein